MATAIQPESKVHSMPTKQKSIHLKTWKEAREYFAAHLTPVAFNAHGRPIYNNEDIKKLNVLLPDEK